MDIKNNLFNSPAKKLFLLAILLFTALILSSLAGRFPLPGLQNPRALLESSLNRTILIHIRLPRVIISLFMGMALATAGLIFQTILNNPMVEPGFLGVSQGASFGAALAIVLLSGKQWQIQILAITFGIAGLTFSIFLGSRFHFGHWVIRLVLAGIAVSALFSSGLGILKYLADREEKLQELSFWLLGGTGGVSWKNLLPIIPVLLIAFTILFLMRWRLNLLSLDDETALSISVNLKAERLIFLICAVVVTSLCISLCGMINWIGMIVPHIARKIFGANTRYTVPATMLLGGLFMMICDDFARVLFPAEIPLGIVTSIIGAVLFFPIMANNKVKA